MGDTEPRRERARSPNHPAFGLGVAIEKAQMIFAAEHTAPVPADVAVKHMGFNGPTGPAVRALGALKTYALMTEEAGTYRFTPDALALMTRPEEAPGVIARLAYKPEVFQHLLHKYPDRLPSQPTLKATLMRDLGLADAAADTVIAALRDNQELVAHQLDPPQDPTASPPPAQVEPVTFPNSRPVAAPGTLQVWSLGRGVSVELRASQELTAGQLGLLKKYVALAEEAARASDAAQAP